MDYDELEEEYEELGGYCRHQENENMANMQRAHEAKVSNQTDQIQSDSNFKSLIKFQIKAGL